LYCCRFLAKADFSDVSLLLKCLRWPPSFVFPGLDLLRMVVLNPVVGGLITSLDEATTGITFFFFFGPPQTWSVCGSG
jgi:hypothetical protein